jgi:hypothetical protein
MPLHDWTRVDAGLFHAFHQRWISALCDTLNSGALPPDYFALPEQFVRGSIPDRSTSQLYADKADRIAVRHRDSSVVAVMEIVSPGNKVSRAEFRAFVEKSTSLIHQGVHLMVIDLFPPSKRDPEGILKAIWNEFQEGYLELPSDKPLSLAAVDAGPPRAIYVEPVAVGDVLPDMPLFLKPEVYVPVPLETTYQTTWNVFPGAVNGLLG